jgi:chromate transporter
MDQRSHHRSDQGELGAIIRLFLRLGSTAFGGPAAHIALMREEVVTRRKWLSEGEFLDLLGATNLIPGPNSTEMAIHIGYLRAGFLGLVIAGVCFIFPAALIVSLLAWGYVEFGSLPEITGILYAVKPVIIAVVAQAIWMLSRSALKSPFLMTLAAGSFASALFGLDELALLFGAGILTGLVRWGTLARSGEGPKMTSLLLMILTALALFLVPAALSSHFPGGAERVPFAPSTLFLFFLKIGSVLYGSGYVLLAFLQGSLVDNWHWLTEVQLLDAAAVGQVTPGPVFTTATFIGYILGGPASAILATVAIFLPSFIFVALSGPLIPRIRRSALAGAFLDGVNASSLALMAAVTVQLGRSAMIDPLTILLAVSSTVLLLRFKVNSAWLIVGAAMVGFAVPLFT